MSWFDKIAELLKKPPKVTPRQDSNGNPVDMSKFDPTKEVLPPKNVAPTLEQKPWIYPFNKAFVTDPTSSGGKLIDTLGHRPTGIVIHHTATSNLNGTIEFFKQNQVSVHFIVGKDGEVIQMAPCNEIAYHAGESSWVGLKSLNKYFVGIEVLNLGQLTKKDDKYFDAYGKEYIGDVRERKTLGFQYWEPFTVLQEQTLKTLCQWLIKTYNIPTSNVIAHFEASPKRKVDPAGGLKMSMDEFRALLI